jgi:acetylornithine deacetylase
MSVMKTSPVEKILSDLVAIPSANPMGRAGVTQYSEKDLAEFIAALLKKHRIDAELYDVAPGRPNVMAYIDVGAPETLLLEAHLDTVGSEQMTIEPFTPAIRDGKLYGRGSCDTKGSIAAFIYSVVSLFERGQKPKYNILFLFVSDEEYCFTGAKLAIKKGIKATFGIAGEPTKLAIVGSHKGVTRWKIRANGTAAHSAYPERGKNAIYRMASVIGRLEQYSSQLGRLESHPRLGTPSLSVGVIEGGQAVNVVPDRCWIEIDRRSLPGETTESIVGAVRSLLKDMPDVDVETPYLSVAGMDLPPDAVIIRKLSDAVKKVRGDVRVEAAQYATDAGFYNTAGIPTVVFGPGDIAQAHTDAEYIELRQLELAVQILQTFMREN